MQNILFYQFTTAHHILMEVFQKFCHLMSVNLLFMFVIEYVFVKIKAIELLD